MFNAPVRSDTLAEQSPAERTVRANGDPV